MGDEPFPPVRASSGEGRSGASVHKAGVHKDEVFMALALEMAARGLGTTAPNPAVGAVLVSADGAEVIARGWTQPGGRPHAEVMALEAAGPGARGSTLYVTLEPCAHHGRTPPCADAVVAAGVARVVCAQRDPDKRVAGRGIARLKAAGLAVREGVLEARARRLTLGHILRVTQNRPQLTLKLATGSDGRIAPGDGAPVWVTGERARAVGHRLRAEHDAIVVGIGTVLADDPALDCRLPGLEGRSPRVIVLDSQCRLPAQARLLQKRCPMVPRPVLACCRNMAGEAVQRRKALGTGAIDIWPLGGNGCGQKGLPLQALAAAMAAQGLTRVLIEGGPRIWTAFLAAGLVDEVVHFRGAGPAGKNSLRPFGAFGVEKIADGGNFALVEERAVGEDLMRVYVRRGILQAGAAEETGRTG